MKAHRIPSVLLRRILRAWLGFCVSALGLLFVSSLALAQDTGYISGTVTDKSGGRRLNRRQSIRLSVTSPVV